MNPSTPDSFGGHRMSLAMALDHDPDDDRELDLDETETEDEVEIDTAAKKRKSGIPSPVGSVVRHPLRRQRRGSPDPSIDPSIDVSVAGTESSDDLEPTPEPETKDTKESKESTTPIMVDGRPYRGKCLYQSRKCENERALKRNGKAHNLCEEHRSKQNQHQRKFDAKKFSQRRRKTLLDEQERQAIAQAQAQAQAQSMEMQHRQDRHLAHVASWFGSGSGAGRMFGGGGFPAFGSVASTPTRPPPPPRSTSMTVGPQLSPDPEEDARLRFGSPRFSLSSPCPRNVLPSMQQERYDNQRYSSREEASYLPSTTYRTPDRLPSPSAYAAAFSASSKASYPSNDTGYQASAGPSYQASAETGYQTSPEAGYPSSADAEPTFRPSASSGFDDAPMRQAPPPEVFGLAHTFSRPIQPLRPLRTLNTDENVPSLPSLKIVAPSQTKEWKLHPLEENLQRPRGLSSLGLGSMLQVKKGSSSRPADGKLPALTLSAIQAANAPPEPAPLTFSSSYNNYMANLYIIPSVSAPQLQFGAEGEPGAAGTPGSSAAPGSSFASGKTALPSLGAKTSLPPLGSKTTLPSLLPPQHLNPHAHMSSR